MTSRLGLLRTLTYTLFRHFASPKAYCLLKLLALRCRVRYYLLPLTHAACCPAALRAPAPHTVFTSCLPRLFALYRRRYARPTLLSAATLLPTCYLSDVPGRAGYMPFRRHGGHGGHAYDAAALFNRTLALPRRTYVANYRGRKTNIYSQPLYRAVYHHAPRRTYLSAVSHVCRRRLCRHWRARNGKRQQAALIGITRAAGCPIILTSHSTYVGAACCPIPTTYPASSPAATFPFHRAAGGERRLTFSAALRRAFSAQNGLNHTWRQSALVPRGRACSLECR